MSKRSTVTVREQPVAERDRRRPAPLRVHGETFVVETDEPLHDLSI